MATSSTNFTALTQPIFHIPTKRLNFFLYRPNNIKILGERIRAVQREDSVVLDVKDRELETKLNRNGNGSLVKYVNGNGNGSVAFRSGVEVVKVDEVISKKKSIEEIGQEEAWFKRKGQDQAEVYTYIW